MSNYVINNMFFVFTGKHTLYDDWDDDKFTSQYYKTRQNKTRAYTKVLLQKYNYTKCKQPTNPISLTHINVNAFYLAFNQG